MFTEITIFIQKESVAKLCEVLRALFSFVWSWQCACKACWWPLIGCRYLSRAPIGWANVCQHFVEAENNLKVPGSETNGEASAAAEPQTTNKEASNTNGEQIASVENVSQAAGSGVVNESKSNGTNAMLPGNSGDIITDNDGPATGKNSGDIKDG